MSDLHEKKSKKDKKRKVSPADDGEDATVSVKSESRMSDAAAAEASEEDAAAEAKRLKKEAKKAKKAKKEHVKEEADEEEAAPASKKTSNALAALADELVVTSKPVDEEEAVDLIALKKSSKNKKLAVHASREANGGADSGAFVPDENAVVIQEAVRVFLGNLPFKITDELLHECFDEFGTIVGIHYVTDKATGNFYGTAFIDFETADAAQASLVRNGVEILGRAIKVNFATGANVAGKNRFNTKEKKGAHLAKLPISEKPADCNTVFLGNLSFNIDDAALRTAFEHCGEITDIRYVEKDGEFKGCGFIEFAESWCTDEAVKLNGSDLLGRPVRVDYSARGSR